MGAPDTAFVRQYQDSISLLAQQLDGRLQSTVMVDNNWTGESKFYDQYASDTFTEIMGRYQDTPIQAPDHRRRAVFPRYFVSNTLEDPQDALAMLIDPKSTYMQAKQAGANRQIDDIIIAAFGSTAYTGKNGTTTQSFTAGNQIAAGGAGMTKTKCITAKVLLDEAEADMDNRFMAHKASQLGDLLNTTEVTSSDYNVVKALVEGQVNTWLGFQWKRSERMLASGGATLCYAYQKKAMQLAIQKSPEGRVSERPDKNYAWQVYMRLALGATRLQESIIVEIACVETF